MPMNEAKLHYYLIIAGFAAAAVVFITLFFVSAPYGKHARRGWGPMVPNKLAWILMETPPPLFFVLYFFIGSVEINLPVILFFGMWQAHYVHRAFIYPFTIRNGHKKMPLVVMLMGMAFNIGNAYVNGRYLFTFSGGYPDTWLKDPRFIIGLILFVVGFIINRWADSVLRGLRRRGEKGYRIPRGGLFNRISCPNYFGEIIEWIGWAVATWSLAGLAFAVWTFANLVPRARSHHSWYHSHFPEYPPERNALIPWFW